MPLPNGATLSLQGHSRPGDSVQSKPKQAMIVRMSTETLEALESFPNCPPMDFEFGENPGIHIGETFFAMRPLKETTPHEIYLRSASAAKPMAPLKLYANVTGKFIVERQLGEKVTDKVRQQTRVAKEERSERRAILLDTPPVPTNSKGVKRKQPGSSTATKKAAHSDSLRVPSASTSGATPTRKVSPLPQVPPSKSGNLAVRNRLIHCLALTPRLGDEVIKLVGGSNPDPTSRADLVDILEDVAEQAPAKKGDKTPRPWTLKASTWLEVRPYQWPRLADSERVTMARRARVAFNQMKIPESDPAWEHVRYRDPAPNVLGPPPPTNAAKSIAGPSASSSSAPPKAEAKRPAISKDPKQKARTEAAKGKGEILMKDESAKVPRVSAIRREEGERSASPTPSNSSKSATRRLPGSGFKVVNKTSPQPSAGSSDNTSKKPAGPVDARSSQRPPPPPSLPAKPAPPVAPPAATQERKSNAPAAAAQITKRPREPVYESDREKDRDKDRIPKERAPIPAAAKRKNVAQESNATPDDSTPKGVKRRKTDEGSVPVPVPSSASKVRDLSLPKKPVQDLSPAPRPKIKKESSPLPPPSSSSSHSQDKVASPLSQPPAKADRPKANGVVAKSRRRSPIYTSSEDEGEIPQPRKRDVPPVVAPPPTNGRHTTAQRPRASHPITKDHSSLRARYNATYSDYLGKFTQIVAEKRKLEALLNGDSEGELDVMGPEELAKLSAEYQARKEELENIHEMFKKGKNGSASD
ncbi:hypothetical protein BV22DRAFT_1057898 [Leucogyrophana mollusca]|uniref:Uncharacterized protein n=1 Tax=Leucogyrophana mollusca TaxID=85980 RepID=A0ACB8BT88_9AGAM|nr:hypothetical protein BV22DRAFT_1057898 [Leucogyrophana mollusca]